MTSTNLPPKFRARGAALYTVDMEWLPGDSSLITRCTCPHFVKGSLCKHIWATLLEAEDVGWAAGASRETNVLHEVLDAGRSIALDDEADYEEEDEDDDDSDYDYPDHPSAHLPTPPHQLKTANWQTTLEGIRYDSWTRSAPETSSLGPSRQAWFAINLTQSEHSGSLVIDYYHRQRLKTGELGKVKRQGVGLEDLAYFEDPADRQIMALLLGNIPKERSPYSYELSAQFNYCHLSPAMYMIVLPGLCATQRLVLGSGPAIEEDALHPIEWKDDDVWRFELQLTDDPAKECWSLSGWLVRKNERVALETPTLVLEDGLILHAGELSPVAVSNDTLPWIEGLRRDHSLAVPYKERDKFLTLWWGASYRPPLDLPAALDLPTICPTPVPTLSVLRSSGSDRNWRYAKVAFRYGDRVVEVDDTRSGYVEPTQVMVRNRPVERDFLEQLAKLGVTRNLGHYYQEIGSYHVGKAKLDQVVFALLETGWMVEVERVRVRKPGLLNLTVDSGIDWFGLNGTLDFDGAEVALPELLRALGRGDEYVLLADGSKGLLPPKWVTEHKLLQLGLLEDDQVIFKPNQALLLDAILAEQETQSRVDAKFNRWRSKLQSFDGIKSRRAPRGFTGALRPYQQDGLGWLHFLREFHLGGCLADDMGLGKTIQGLALLESIRTTATAPSLVVVPRSLVFNWVAEAARFTPGLKVLEYIGSDRSKLRATLNHYDLIVTTYGTLRKDIAHLREIHFEYVILDEAQAIKNAASVTAKACRVLDAAHHLAMTGTPVENHLGELWSLFEFLNPGLLGSAKMFAGMTKEHGDQQTSLNALAAGLRPYLLRRTKEQVAADLPTKTEQTIYCELEGKQRTQYEELREYYASLLDKTVAAVGLNRSKIQVLEALLRLRQAACHPGLIDAERATDSSAKLGALTEQISEVLDGGHKALVFSQFTKFLAIVRTELDSRDITYEYLDGRTRKREECVRRFQEDPDSKLFLISLKAGGHGLNLTAADYVFLLDPWWNPAVEAQAVGRAHRIGQTRPVFAYRLIARDTVEEKILLLQDKKLALAESIIREDRNLLRTLTTEDLSLLLS